VALALLLLLLQMQGKTGATAGAVLLQGMLHTYQDSHHHRVVRQLQKEQRCPACDAGDRGTAAEQHALATSVGVGPLRSWLVRVC
jgi:tartrate dehydratase beta subunit/fumarate hydratase class I family protein